MTHGCRILRPCGQVLPQSFQCLPFASRRSSASKCFPAIASSSESLDLAMYLQNHKENTRLMGWILGLLPPGFWRIPGILNVNSQSWSENILENQYNQWQIVNYEDRHRRSWRSWNSAETRVNHGQIMNRSSVFAGRIKSVRVQTASTSCLTSVPTSGCIPVSKWFITHIYPLVMAK